MNEERRKVLEMLSEGKINVEEAEKLLSALTVDSEIDPGRAEQSPGGKKNLKFLRILVDPGPDSKDPEKVNIKVPLKLIRSGLKLASFISNRARIRVNRALEKKGIKMDISQIKPEDLDEFITQLSDLKVDVEGDDKVKIFCE